MRNSVHKQIIELQPYQTLLLKGPAEFTTEEYGITVLAKPISKTQTVIVRQNKILPFENKGKSVIKVILKRYTDFQLATGSVGVDIWRRVQEQVFDTDIKNRTIIIVGSTDSGKSTLSSYLLNLGISRGLSVGVIDADVGQGDLAPPGCIGGKIFKEQIFDLRDFEADFYGFVGTNSPRGVGHVVLSEINRVRDRLAKATIDFYIINTDGYVSGDGYLSKVDIIRDIDPAAIICFDGVNGTQTLYHRFRQAFNCDVIMAKRFKYSIKKVSERIDRRRSQYRRFIIGCNLICIDIKKIKVSFLGKHYDLQTEIKNILEIIKKDAYGNLLVIRSDYLDHGKIIEDSQESRVVLSLNSINGMFVALGSAGKPLKFGRCVGFYSDFSINILIEPIDNVDTLFLSLIKLNQDVTKESNLILAKTNL